MEDVKDKATELTEEELKDVDGAGCGCEDVPVLKKELTEEELKGVDGGSILDSDVSADLDAVRK